MKQIVVIILSTMVTAAVLIASLTGMIAAHKGPQHEGPAVTHGEGSH
jgi:hypothetical protein